MKKETKSREKLLEEFHTAHPDTLFSTETYCAVFQCSFALAARNRWERKGVPFVKAGHFVRYKKQDILDWIEKQKQLIAGTQGEKNEA